MRSKTDGAIISMEFKSTIKARIQLVNELKESD